MKEITAKMGYEYAIDEDPYSKNKGVIEITITSDMNEDTYDKLEEQADILAVKLRAKLLHEAKGAIEGAARKMAESLTKEDREEIIKLKRELKGE